MRCGVTSEAGSFCLQFVTRHEREQFNSLLYEADEKYKNMVLYIMVVQIVLLDFSFIILLCDPYN